MVAVQYPGRNVKRNVFSFGSDFEDSRNIGKYFPHGPSGDAPHLGNFGRREMPLLGYVSPRFIGRHARLGDLLPCVVAFSPAQLPIAQHPAFCA